MCRNRDGIGPAPSRGRPHSAKRAVGFTLIELLVALAIFAIITGFAYRSLDALLQGREALQQESRKWRDVSVFVSRIERDLAAVLDRSSLGASGVAQAPVSSSIEVPTARDGLALTRSGAPLYENALAAPQRIAYRLVEDRVERLSWGGVDVAPRAEPTPVTVLAGARALAFRFMDASGAWRGSWGLPGSVERVPAAVELTLELASGEKLVRLVDLPRSR
ncbi:MAG: type II secretion system minor pseudopilin GspJ [Usitatibacter sp.]